MQEDDFFFGLLEDTRAGQLIVQSLITSVRSAEAAGAGRKLSINNDDYCAIAGLQSNGNIINIA